MKKLISLALTFFFLSTTSHAANLNMKFVMAHKPDNEENINLIKLFSENVKKRTDGRVIITPVMPEEVITKEVLKSHGPHKSAIQKLYVGEIEMGQVSAKIFSNYSNTINVLDAPLIFKNHEHAAKVLDGSIGEEIIKTVSVGSNGRLEGLSFTYSGGFRNFYSVNNIERLSDLEGMKIRLLGGRMSRDITDHLGLKIVDITPHGKDWVNALLGKQLEIDEAELIRLETYGNSYPSLIKSIKTIIETNHNLYLTMVTINGTALKKLTAKEQKILKEEAQKLAVAERSLSIQQEKAAKDKFEKMGIKFLKMNQKDLERLTIAAEKTKSMYKDTLSKWYELIESELKAPVLAKD